MLFINAIKVAGVLQRLNGMISHSDKPCHFWMWSSRCHPPRSGLDDYQPSSPTWSSSEHSSFSLKILSINGKGQRFLIVILLTAKQSMHIYHPLSFFWCEHGRGTTQGATWFYITILEQLCHLFLYLLILYYWALVIARYHIPQPILVAIP